MRYRRLFESAQDGILIVDPDTRKILDVNPFLVRFLGFDYGDLVGKELFEIGLLKDETASQEAFEALRTSGYIRYEDLPLRTKDGRTVDVEFVSNLYKEGPHQIIQCNIRDISARRKVEDAMVAAREQQAQRTIELESLVAARTHELRLSNAQLETFVYTIAHDLRAPLRTMQGFSQLLAEDHAAGLNAEGRSYASYIADAAQTMDRMLTDLLALSHLSQKKVVLMPVSLAAVVHSAIAGCETEIQAGHARVESLPPWPWVRAHAPTLRQVLVNLIANAVKFAGGKPPRVRLHAEERPAGVVRVWVEDNGIGIPEEFQARIFQVFQRLHPHQYDGTGIGLAIVQKGMESMDGHTGVISTPGAGSRFWIELPGAATVRGLRETAAA